MLDMLDLSLKLDKATYVAERDRLALQLRSLQADCREAQLPVIIALEGWAAAGKGAIVKALRDSLDPRGFQVHPIFPPEPHELGFPWLRRFWLRLPEAGTIGLFYHSWYSHLLEDRLFGRLPDPQFPEATREVNAFERQLADEGAAIAKFFIHLGRDELKKRLKKYQADPFQAWRVRPEDWQQAKHYRQYRDLAEAMLAETSTGAAPWTLVEGNSRRWAVIKVLSETIATIAGALDRQRSQASPPPALPAQAELHPGEPDLLARVNLSQALSRSKYERKLAEQQARLRSLQMQIHRQRLPVLVLFEGWDAAGKGGAISRLTGMLDPRSYEVHAFAAPTAEERAHHYLWRFWRWLPAAGTIGIFDRSWYGRVLVERIEGFATETEWRRAYQEINEFESQLMSSGMVLVKVWLHISPEEQLRRFQERKDNPFKQYKLTDEDWRNRERWPLYSVAVNQMVQRTHTPLAPWTLIAAEDKYFARVAVATAVADAIERRLTR